jgi:hypothetical protein
MQYFLCYYMQLDVSDFHGKELSLKLHMDGNLGSLQSPSGKILKFL